MFIKEDEIEEGTDGSYLGQQYFRCPPGRAVFVPVRQCKLDSRFGSSVSEQSSASSRYDMTLEAGKYIFCRLFEIEDNSQLSLIY